jgi:DNA invertase Pin-like site-specific DNA recombinase
MEDADMAKNVTTIPATRNRFTADPISSRKKRKVAGYARVSTDMEDQQTSYAAQCDYYTSFIQSREDWEFVGLYSDDGISGTRFDRPGFTAMMEEVEAGNVEAIIIKDMSRLGRDYLKVGQVMEILRQRGIRLIAINDGVDSAN